MEPIEAKDIDERRRRFFIFNALFSAAAVALIAVILLRDATAEGAERGSLPAFNATCNALSALCLTAGWISIRRRVIGAHRAFMIGAFILSALFLIGYLTHHFQHGDTPYQGIGVIRVAYFAILVSHILLSLVVVPGALASFYFALTRDFTRHRRLNRILAPVWLYVSVTGVVIFFMLR